MSLLTDSLFLPFRNLFFKHQVLFVCLVLTSIFSGCTHQGAVSAQASSPASLAKEPAEHSQVTHSTKSAETTGQVSAGSETHSSRNINQSSDSDEEPKIVKVVFKSNSGRQKAIALVETVSKPQELSRGLMYRKTLGENNGMLFLMGRKKVLSFWMKNTYIPLSIAFINDDMRIVDIHKMRPLNEDIHYLSSEPCRYAVEMNQGWFKKHRIREKDVVEFLFQ